MLQQALMQTRQAQFVSQSFPADGSRNVHSALHRSPSRHVTRPKISARQYNAMNQVSQYQHMMRGAMRLEQINKLNKSLGFPEIDPHAYFLLGTGPPQHPSVAAQQHQQQLQQQNYAQRNGLLEHQLAQRRAKKPTDRNMPDGIEDVVIGDGVQQYKELREMEKKLDYAIMRKRLDIQDTVNRNVKRQKTMRIWISNTVDSQPWQRPALDADSFDFESGADATYRVTIQGKIIDDQDLNDPESGAEDDEEEPAPAKQSRPKPQPKKFSHYFKAVSVDFDRARNMGNPNIDPSMQIEWKKTPQTGEFDSFEFNRKGDENMNVTINMTRDEPVERFRLSKALSDVLDIEEADRAEVVMGIWEYVKAMGLQEDEERRHVRCDEKLRAVSQNHPPTHPLQHRLISTHRSSTPKQSSSHKSPNASCLTSTPSLQSD
jgi:SWI/SNF-related matrix-associated actin-dependent regulator of chromatin subfamily D